MKQPQTRKTGRGMTRAYRRKLEALEQERKAEELASELINGAEDAGNGAEQLPEGLYEMLQLKSVLQKDLRIVVEKPVVVSVDLNKDNNEWFFVVRGCAPVLDRWNGRDVVYIPSSSIGIQDM